MLRRRPDVTLEWHEGGPAGLTDFEARTISLRRGMSQAERRSTLRHELEHIYRGPGLEGYVDAEEMACELSAARDLIDIRKLGEAMAWTESVHDLAEELWVDVNMVRMRLGHLHPAERAYLKRRLSHLD